MTRSQLQFVPLGIVQKEVRVRGGGQDLCPLGQAMQDVIQVQGRSEIKSQFMQRRQLGSPPQRLSLGFSFNRLCWRIRKLTYLSSPPRRRHRLECPARSGTNGNPSSRGRRGFWPASGLRLPSRRFPQRPPAGQRGREARGTHPTRNTKTSCTGYHRNPMMVNRICSGDCTHLQNPRGNGWLVKKASVAAVCQTALIPRIKT